MKKLIWGIATIPAGLIIFNQVRVSLEKKKLVPPGRLFSVNGHSMHVYLEGERKDAPLLVFLSGAATAAPVYDFKPLYSLLSKDYRIAVVERAGYGYSEIAGTPRDIDCILAETREALRLSGETAPYILIPHSLSGLEAIRWAQMYPDEIKGIIALDIAVPSAYTGQNANKLTYFMNSLNPRLIRAAALTGFPRVSKKFIVSDLSLSPDEHKQAKLLLYRNAYNKSVINEISAIFSNSRIIEENGNPGVPALFFYVLINEPKWWNNGHRKFIEDNPDTVTPVILECGHYIHQFEAERIAEESKKFINNLTGV